VVYRKIIVLLLLSSVVLAMGCTTSNEPNMPDEYHVGTDGLELNFLSGTPPRKIFEGDDLTIVVEITNIGAYPSGDSGDNFDGRLFIGGYDASYVPMSPTSIQLDSGLYGKDQYNSDGTFDTETFEASSVSLPEETDLYEPTLQVTACYSYKTYASPVVCIDPDPYSSELEDEVCQVRDQTLSGGQGAPVAVTRVEESVTKDNVKFKIFFRNVGNGYVVDSGYIDSDCPDTDRDNLDKVDVSVRMSNAQGSCRPDNPVRLVNGQGFVVCDFPKPAESVAAYTTPLQVELDYGYSTAIEKKVTIINE